MKRIKRSVLALAILGAFAIPASARAQNQIEQIALTILAQKFGINTQQALSFRNVSRQSAFDSAPIYATSYYTHRSANEVWKLRQQGLGWGEIAHRLGMNPGRFNKLRKSGAFDRDAIWRSIYRDRYGARDSDFVAIRRRGGSMRDLLPTFIIARASRRDPIVVYKRYERDRDWDRTASVYKVDWRNHEKYARPTGSAKSAGPAQGGMRSAGRDQRDAKRPEVGQGKGRPQDMGQGNGQGRGKGNSIGQGNGQGRGKGNSNDQGHGKGKSGHGKGNR